MKRYLLILQILLSCTFLTNAQNFVVNVPTHVSIGENFRLAYTINTDNVHDFRIGNIPEELEIITGPYTSSQSSYQMINGHTSSSSSKTFTFILCATKNGTYTIPSAHIVANGKRLASKAVRVKVSGTSQQNGGAPRMHDDADNQSRLKDAGTPIGGGIYL